MNKIISLLLTENTGRLKFSLRFPPFLCWLLILPIAIISYVFVKIILLVMVFFILSFLPNATANEAYWLGFILGSIVGSFICSFSFCLFGSAIAPNHNNTVCLLLGILLAIIFAIPFMVGYLVMISVIPYLSLIIGIILVNIYRQKNY